MGPKEIEFPRKRCGMSRVRNWCFTVNNYSKDDLERLSEVQVGYIVYGFEVGESGTPHLQGYVELLNPKSMSATKKYLGVECHLEARKGTGLQASDYCKKGEEYVERGELKNPNGVTKQYKEIVDHIKDGRGLRELVEDGASLHILQYARNIIPLLEEGRNFKTQVWWLHGATGTGKSRYCHEMYPEAYWKSPTTKWWDGYDGQDVVVVDDYRKDFCTFAELLRLCDRYPLQVEYKGGTRQFRPKVLVFTSPKSWEDWWLGRTDEDLAQLKRRIEYTLEVGTLEWYCTRCTGNPG